MSIDPCETPLTSIRPGNDKSSDEALSQAAGLVQEFGAEICINAIVNRFHGLVLEFSQPNLTTVAGWHFATAICGYDGAGPMASARILAAFDFGTYEDIFARISRGGNTATFVFTK